VAGGDRYVCTGAAALLYYFPHEGETSTIGPELAELAQDG
jgi:hypothetical protein